MRYATRLIIHSRNFFDRSIKIHYWNLDPNWLDNANISWFWYMDAGDILSGTGMVLCKLNYYLERVNKTFFVIGQINDPLGPNPALFRRDIDNSTLADHILFDTYQVGRYLQLQKTSGRFMIAEIEMTFANICKYHKFRTWYSYSHFIFYLKFSSRSNASSQRLL